MITSTPKASRMRGLALTLAATALALPLSGCLNDSSSSAPKRLFVTSQAYAGNFGGVTAADSICNTLATAALLGGQWKSFLSDSTMGALQRMGEVGPWFRVEPAGAAPTTKIFNNRVGFTVGALATINNEYGAGATNARVWTGTTSSGTTDGEQTCSNWKATTGYGTDGNPNSLLANGPKWMYSAEGASQCVNTKRLYCFEQ